jgi:penicillin-binding protein 1C
MLAVDMARWPAALEPWLDAATRSRALPPAWSSACQQAVAPGDGLKIIGISSGETIRRAASGGAPLLRLEARGARQALIWLVDGRQIARTAPGKALQQRFAEPGRHTITVMDDSGRYDRVEISVQ